MGVEARYITTGERYCGDPCAISNFARKALPTPDLTGQLGSSQAVWIWQFATAARTLRRRQNLPSGGWSQGGSELDSESELELELELESCSEHRLPTPTCNSELQL